MDFRLIEEQVKILDGECKAPAEDSGELHRV
jgi:hypothetical protein